MEVDDLTDEQHNALARFREFTHIDSVETCRQYLVAHEWDVERAIETALISESDLPFNMNDDRERMADDRLPSDPSLPEPFLDELPLPTAPNTTTNDRYIPNTSVPLFRIILSLFYTLYLKIQPYLPWTIIHIFSSFVRSLVWSGRPIDPLKEIDDYCTYFDNQYGTRHPVFYRGKFSQALLDAQREVRLLFIYLHEKNSPLSDRFCREVLCEEALASTIGNNLLWSTSTDTQEGAIASRLLHANSFPCICIVAHQGSQQTVQLRFDQYIDADECLAEIINGVQNADQTLQYNRERRNTRNSRDRLLEEQNAAYLDSVRADQEKAEQRSREDNQRRQLEEDQQRLQEEQQQKLQKIASFRDRIRQTLPCEPSSTETDTIRVSIRLPASEPIRRRFRRCDPVKLLFEFAWTNSNVPDQFELLWGYPRKHYQYEQIGDKTIGDVMIGNTETCYLEQIDDEK